MSAATGIELLESVGVAVIAQAQHLLHVARGLALVPELLARAAEEVGLAGLPRARESLFVHVGEREHLARARVLHDAWHETVLVECDCRVQAVDFRGAASRPGAPAPGPSPR